MSVLTDIIDRSRTGGMRKEDFREIDYDSRENEVLYSGEYKGVRYMIMYAGLYPMCAVECDEKFGYMDFARELFSNIDVPGGISYIRPLEELFNSGMKDPYACCFSWVYLEPKKLTTAELIRDAKNAIDQHKEIYG